jgi:hypothetical protein
LDTLSSFSNPSATPRVQARVDSEVGRAAKAREMSVVHVAVPMLRGRSELKHLMLDAVADEPASAAELSISSKLPRRIVVEAFSG